MRAPKREREIRNAAFREAIEVLAYDKFTNTDTCERARHNQEIDELIALLKDRQSKPIPATTERSHMELTRCPYCMDKIPYLEQVLLRVKEPRTDGTIGRDYQVEAFRCGACLTLLMGRTATIQVTSGLA